MAQPMDVLVTTGLDAFGESTTIVAVPNGMPPGASLTTQCLLTTPTGFVVSNPERVVF